LLRYFRRHEPLWPRMSRRCVFEFTPTRALIDTAIPGYQPEWRVDLAMSYFRQLIVQRIVDGVVTSLSIDEAIAPGRPRARRHRTAHVPPAVGRPVH